MSLRAVRTPLRRLAALQGDLHLVSWRLSAGLSTLPFAFIGIVFIIAVTKAIPGSGRGWKFTGGNVHRASILAIAALLIPAAVVSQTDTSVGIDSMGLVFRGTIDSVAAVAGHGSLRDRQLPRGTLREVRVYIGFGIGYPQKAVMIREDSIGVHGWLGLWWPGAIAEAPMPAPMSAPR